MQATADVPSEVRLELANTGESQFAVHYKECSSTVMFPFVAAPVDSLLFSGPAGCNAANYDDPLIGGATVTTAQRLIGRIVRVSYRSGKANIEQLEGHLTQLDDTAVVIDTSAGTSTLRRDVVVQISALQLSGEPRLNLQLQDPGKSLDVAGVDTQLQFRAAHSLIIEPVSSSTDAGACVATLRTHVTVSNGYAYPIVVDKLTLVEHEQLTPERSEEATAMAAAPRAEYRKEHFVAESGQSGAIPVPFPVVVADRQQSTVLNVGQTKFEAARWHLLGSADPSNSNLSGAVPLDFVIRLRSQREQANTPRPFVLSGPVAVHLDMDPLPGDDHLLPTPLQLGFYWNAWDHAAARRLYQRLGRTTLLTVQQETSEELRAKDEHSAEKNKHAVHNRYVLSNKSPYDATCKIYLRPYGDRVLTDVKLHEGDARRAKISAFVPEQETDMSEPGVYTLTVVVPRNTKQFPVGLRTEYYLRR